MDKKTAALEKLHGIVQLLRGSKGCPWDRAQKLGDMGRYLLEETCEAVDAIEDSQGRPSPAVREELGDVLMNVFLAAQIAEDGKAFDLADVASGISEKLLRRHPHVFGDRFVEGVDQVLHNWNIIKAREKESGLEAPSRPASRLDRVPRSLPALERSYELARQAAKVGFDWPDAKGAFDKVVEETREVQVLLERQPKDPMGPAAPSSPPERPMAPGSLETGGLGQDRAVDPRMEEEIGDLLFAVSNLSRKLGVRPERALRRALQKFCERFRAIEERIPRIETATLEEMEAVWQETKAGRGAPASGTSSEGS